MVHRKQFMALAAAGLISVMSLEIGRASCRERV